MPSETSFWGCGGGGGGGDDEDGGGEKRIGGGGQVSAAYTEAAKTALPVVLSCGAVMR